MTIITPPTPILTDAEPFYTFVHDATRADAPYVILQNGQPFLYAPSQGAAVQACTALGLLRDQILKATVFFNGRPASC
jgi:hypothetical protein